MERTTIMLPRDLKARTVNQAKKRKMSLGQYVREALRNSLEFDDKRRPSDDPFFCDSAVFEGSSPKGLSSDHDDYLYGGEA
jgi:hypothetical protein